MCLVFFCLFVLLALHLELISYGSSQEAGLKEVVLHVVPPPSLSTALDVL